MPRYVILHHTGHPSKEDHYDLMLERERALKTWVLPSPRLDKAEAIQSFDHRPAYLDYQGEVSGGRGTVRRVESGSFEVLIWDSKQIRIRLGSGELDMACKGDSGEGAVWSLRLKQV
jgi:hypothetical protein